MALTFPNVSRSFDDRRQCVRFTGYDGMSEIRFFISIAALQSAKPHRGASESDSLASFDDQRERILKAATAAYAKKRGNTIELDLPDMR